MYTFFRLIVNTPFTIACFLLNYFLWQSAYIVQWPKEKYKHHLKAK